MRSKIRKETSDLKDYIEILAKRSNDSGRNIIFSIREMEAHAGYEIRLLETNTTAMLDSAVSFAALYNGGAYKVADMMFKTRPFSVLSKLEKALK